MSEVVVSGADDGSVVPVSTGGGAQVSVVSTGRTDTVVSPASSSTAIATASGGPVKEVDVGTRGSKGDKGQKGIKGEKGFKGNIGEGQKGIKGGKGNKGDKGLKGLKGIEGDKGDKGDKGLKGLKGEKGLKGQKGIEGDKGDKGIKGDKGLKGLKGEKGLKGLKGIEGNKGSKGDKGKVGGFGGDSQPFIFNTSTSSVDPGTGKIALNNATPSSVSTISVSNTSSLSADVTSWIRTFDDNANSIRSRIKLFKENDSNVYAIYNVYTISYEGHSDWSAIYVTHVNSNGSFSSSDSIILTLAIAGDKGNVGTGSKGDKGDKGTVPNSAEYQLLYASGSPPTDFVGIKGVFASHHDLMKGNPPDHLELRDSYIEWSGDYNPYTGGKFQGINFQGKSFYQSEFDSRDTNAFISGAYICPASGNFHTGSVRAVIPNGDSYQSAGTSGVQELGHGSYFPTGFPDTPITGCDPAALPWKKIWVNEIGTTEIPHGIPASGISGDLGVSDLRIGGFLVPTNAAFHQEEVGDPEIMHYGYSGLYNIGGAKGDSDNSLPWRKLIVNEIEGINNFRTDPLYSGYGNPMSDPESIADGLQDLRIDSHLLPRYDGIYDLGLPYGEGWRSLTVNGLVINGGDGSYPSGQGGLYPQHSRVDLGSEDEPFQSLYVSESSIHIGQKGNYSNIQRGPDGSIKVKGLRVVGATGQSSDINVSSVGMIQVKGIEIIDNAGNTEKIEVGPSGLTGAKGLKGLKGSKGDTGIKGATGSGSEYRL